MKQITGIVSCQDCPYSDELRIDWSGVCNHPKKIHVNENDGFVEGMNITDARIIHPDCPLEDQYEERNDCTNCNYKDELYDSEICGPCVACDVNNWTPIVKIK